MTPSTVLGTQAPAETADVYGMAEPETYRDLMDCPAWRLGEALRLHRETVGLTLEEISKRVDFAFTPVVLQMIELGRYPLEPAQVLIAVWGYDADPEFVLPIRDQLNHDDEHHKFSSGPTVRELTRSSTATALLYEYLAFLYQLRGLEPGSTVPLREADLAVLSSTTRWPLEEVREHLTSLMVNWHEAEPHDPQSPTRRNRTGVLGAAIPVGLIQRFHRKGTDS